MTAHNRPTGIHRVVLAALMLVMLAVASLPTGRAEAGVAFAVPSVGEIVVDSYDCETGAFSFHVPVESLFGIDPKTTVFSDYPLVYAHEAYYGPEDDLQPVFSGVFVWTPAEAQSLYTGVVNLEGVVSPTHDGEAIAAIGFQVQVGPGDTLDNPSDSSFKSYIVDCPVPDDDLVQQLVALLIQILQDILNA